MRERLRAKAPLRGVSACHIKIINADGTTRGYRMSLNRPRPWWNLRGWLWLAQRVIEYKGMERRHA